MGFSWYCSHSRELHSAGWTSFSTVSGDLHRMRWVCLGTVHMVGSYTVWDGFVLGLFTWWGDIYNEMYSHRYYCSSYILIFRCNLDDAIQMGAATCSLW